VCGFVDVAVDDGDGEVRGVGHRGELAADA
jgi:hypothetical protein